MEGERVPPAFHPPTEKLPAFFYTFSEEKSSEDWLYEWVLFDELYQFGRV